MQFVAANEQKGPVRFGEMRIPDELAALCTGDFLIFLHRSYWVLNVQIV